MMGKVTGGIRIKPEPIEVPELTPNHESWEKAKSALSNGQATIQQIKTKYKLTAENEALLIAE